MLVACLVCFLSLQDYKAHFAAARFARLRQLCKLQ